MPPLFAPNEKEHKALKVLFITLDGLGDRPVPEFDGRTPLEVAHTHHMDSLAAAGINGLLTAVAPGIPAGTPTAHALLFGYHLNELPGRAMFHSVARGIVPPPEDVICLARFANVQPTPQGVRLLHRVLHGPEEDFASLAEAIRKRSVDGVEMELAYTGHGEGVLFLRGTVSDEITDCDPIGMDLPVIKAEPMERASDPEAASGTAEALNQYLRWAHTVLREHPVNARREREGHPSANFLLAKWTARRTPMQPFQERFGFKAVSITSEEVLRGVMHELGVETRIEEKEATEEDMVMRLSMARGFLAGEYDFVHVHTKQPDLIAHYAEPKRKMAEIEALDRGLGYLVKEILPDRELVVALSSDHSTPSVVAAQPAPGDIHDQHSGEPVPLMIVGRNALRDDVPTFSERVAARGGLGLVRGADFMHILMSQAERTNVIGWRPTARESLHRPTQVEPFEL